MYGCALNYVTLRLLGLPATDPVLTRARTLLHRLGSAKAIPSWGKLVLALLNCYDYEGMHNICPEMWLVLCLLLLLRRLVCEMLRLGRPAVVPSIEALRPGDGRGAAASLQHPWVQKGSNVTHAFVVKVGG